jgi:hypothetical protein
MAHGHRAFVTAGRAGPAARVSIVLVALAGVGLAAGWPANARGDLTSWRAFTYGRGRTREAQAAQPGNDS